MKSFDILLGVHTVQVYQWGEGPHWIIGWHGFRQKGEAFAKMGKLLPKGYTLYAPDLPFHGETNWQAEEYHDRDLWAIIAQLPGYREGQKVILAGFSLGGYIAGGLAISRPDATERLVLLAPDTRYTTWGWFTHGLPHAWRVGLERRMSKPGRLLQWADRLYRFGIINRFTLAFLHRTVADRSRRRQLFGTWRARTHFPFSIPELARLEMSIQVILGKEDPLIPGKKIRRRMEHFATVTMVDARHDLLPKAELWVDQVT